jgi:hypothetical protein
MGATVYIAPALGALFVGYMLWRTPNPPPFGYVAFTVFVATLALIVMVDTDWLYKLHVQWGADTYALVKPEISPMQKSARSLGNDSLAGIQLGHAATSSLATQEVVSDRH